MRPLLLLLAAALALPACSTSEQRAADRKRESQEKAQEKLEEQKDKEQERADKAQDARERVTDDAAMDRAYEVEYARQLGKDPSQLTPEERKWVHDHF